MFFYISKVLGILVQPLNFLVLGFLLVLVLAWRGMGRIPKFIAVILGFALFLTGFTQLPDYLLYTLEREYPLVEKFDDNFEPAGIIILGGSIIAHKKMKRNWYHIGEAGERLIEGVALARRYPKAVLVYTGGNASIDLNAGVEAHAFNTALQRFAPLSNQVMLETKSRNTWQNAIFTKELISGVKSGAWLLVTSAYHMKRSMAVFEKAGVDVKAWPTDFLANELRSPWLSVRSLTQLAKFRTYVHEMIGIVAYRFSGRA